jgi:methionyl-tRNA formyltransferase
MEGETETGVTVMYMAEGLDTGDIISVEKFPILPEDDFEAIHDRSAEVGGKLLSETIEKIYNGTAERIAQDDSLACYAKKVEKEDCKIDFSLPASKLDCIIRGVTPIPGAFAYLNGKMLKINKACPIDGKGQPGKVIEASDKGDGYIIVACGEGALKITMLIPEGKGKMSAGDFLRGRKIAVGDLLE